MTTVTTRAVANPGAMRAAVALAYAVTCYLLFLASFLAFAAFVGGLLPSPFALDVSPWQAAAIDIGLVVAFGLQHSIMARQGFKRVWTRIVPPVAERATPEAIINKVNKDIVSVIGQPDVQKRFLDQAAKPVANSPQEAAAFIASESQLWGDVIKKAGLAVSLPGDRPAMLRGLSLRHDGPAVLIVDEASRVRDELWATISPMLAAAPAAQQILLSTPAGANGECHRAFTPTSALILGNSER
jgi:hypothetical protein